MKLLESENITKQDVVNISKEEALVIAQNYWEIQNGDIDEDTGFPIAIYVHDELSDNMEYLADLRWFVDNNHWSGIDRIYIDAVSGECRLYYE